MTRVLVVTGGHPFEADPFFAIFDDIPGIHWSRDRTPGRGFDVIVFYDMPGLSFTSGEPPVELSDPPAATRKLFASLLAEGVGLVFLHHAVAGWPTWEDYGELIGARFFYRPGTLRGQSFPDSGYRFDVTHEVSILDPTHPVCAGLPRTFTLTDELYCFPVLEDSVTPLMTTTFPVDDSSHFYSADLAIRGRLNARDDWTHPAGSALVAWAKRSGNSNVVYLQFGDGPETYRNAHFRRALSNAITWAHAR